MGDVRTCAHCGAVFEPRREHARFCSAACRIAWNSERLGDPSVGPNALVWSVSAMSDMARQLARVSACDGPEAFLVIGEMVWWVTLVDATLVRYHTDAYDRVRAGYPLARRRQIDGTLGGLRFVRNRMSRDTGCADFVLPAGGPVTAWTWRPVAAPPLAALRPRGRAWELSRYQDYQSQLAGRTVEETFGAAEAFLKRAADAASVTEDARERHYAGT